MTRRRVAIAAAVLVLVGGLAAGWWRSRVNHGYRRAVDIPRDGGGRDGGRVDAPARDGDGAQIVPLPAGAVELRGTVTDTTGGPIAGARIRVLERMAVVREARAVTAADGAYHLRLPPGEYLVSAEHDDYEKDSQLVDLDGAAVVRDFALLPGASIEGTVATRAGAPVPGATVEVRDGRGASHAPVATAIADERGAFALRGLGPGPYVLGARGPGGATPAPVDVTVAIGEARAGIALVLDRAHAIHGRVVRADRPAEGMADVLVLASAASELPDLSARTDATGAFELAGVIPARYRVKASPRGTLEREPIEIVVADADVDGLVFALEPAAILRGRVEPPGPAIVEVRQILAERGGELEFGEDVRTDERGAFEVACHQRGPAELRAKTADGRRGSITVESTDGGRAGLVIDLAPRASVRGTVRDPRGAPVAGATVWGTGDSVTSAADGTYRVTGLDAGHVELRAYRGVDFAEEAEVELELAAGEQRTGVDLHVPAADATVRGIVVDASGAPVADAKVVVGRAVPPGGCGDCLPQVVRAGFSGATGAFAIAQLEARAYDAYAIGPRSDARSPLVRVEPGGGPVRLALAALGSLTVRAVDEAGAPVAAYDLQCKRRVGLLGRHVIAADGAVTVANVDADTFDCEAATASASGAGTVAVAGGPAALTIEMRGGGVTVTGRFDKAVAGAAVEIDGLAGALAAGGTPTVTDATGRFVIRAAPSGHHVVEVYDEQTGHFGGAAYTARPGDYVDVGELPAWQ